jgi:CubicO group peptidase (beta-lactamase class C family)
MSASRSKRNCPDPHLAVIFALGALCATTPGAPAVAASSPPATEQHIQHIQDALVPPVLVKGEPGETTTLSDRMASLHVPGVSIAVIHDGKLEWARGFGVTRIDGPAVTPSTLFQAASISKPVTALGVLRLVQMGKLDLDADVSTVTRLFELHGIPNTFVFDRSGRLVAEAIDMRTEKQFLAMLRTAGPQ